MAMMLDRDRLGKIISIVIFILVAIVLIMPLAAEVKFNHAQKLRDGYLWEKAERQFSEAIKMYPFNASHLVGYGDFLRSIAPTRDNEVFLFRQAEKLYKRAAELDPLNAQYPLGIGEIKLKLFLIDKDRYKEELKESLKYFKIALKNDPNGFNVSYEIGYYGIEAWPYLDMEFKKLIIERLRYALVQRVWYWEYIYPWVRQNTDDFEVLERITPPTEEAHRDLLYFVENNNFYQFYHRETEAVNFYMKKEKPEKFLKKEREKSEEVERLKKEYRDKLKLKEINGNSLSSSNWQGKSDGGNDEFKDGAMYWTGTMSAIINVPKDPAVLTIQAKGEQADGIYPYMIVELDDKEIGEMFVSNNEWKEYSFPVRTSAGIKVLSITFCNDGGDANKHEDRNLYIGEARIEIEK